MMREDIQKWLEALRSGDYQQCQQQLTDGRGYCCLGVYAVINGIDIPVPNYGAHDDEIEANRSSYKEMGKLIPYAVFSKGISMNDDGNSFAEIANMIEEYYTND